ncbi:MAG: OmpA family protein [Armatimonadetes bacterium]|nr:OmpA family protein [Armatimonadota bacterium]
MAERKEAASEIRIIRRGKSHGGHHGGAWKVAFADFMTAMMAFFLVMWICGLSDNIKQSVAGYFQDPIGFMEAVNSGKSPFKAPGAPDTGKKDQKSATNGAEKQRLEIAKKSIETMIASSPEFKGLKDALDIKMVDEGLLIELLDGEKNLFFDSGSSRVKLATSHLLGRIAKELGQLDNHIIIEGHTDKRPLSRRAGYTNWELSADRANAARTIMQANGLKPDQIDQVRGYAATHPRNPDPYHYSNRRVSIIVVFNKHESSEKTSVGTGQDIENAVTDKIAPESGSEKIDVGIKL